MKKKMQAAFKKIQKKAKAEGSSGGNVKAILAKMAQRAKAAIKSIKYKAKTQVKQMEKQNPFNKKPLDISQCPKPHCDNYEEKKIVIDVTKSCGATRYQMLPCPQSNAEARETFKHIICPYKTLSSVTKKITATFSMCKGTKEFEMDVTPYTEVATDATKKYNNKNVICMTRYNAAVSKAYTDMVNKLTSDSKLSPTNPEQRKVSPTKPEHRAVSSQKQLPQGSSTELSTRKFISAWRKGRRVRVPKKVTRSKFCGMCKFASMVSLFKNLASGINRRCRKECSIELGEDLGKHVQKVESQLVKQSQRGNQTGIVGESMVVQSVWMKKLAKKIKKHFNKAMNIVVGPFKQRIEKWCDGLVNKDLSDLAECRGCKNCVHKAYGKDANRCAGCTPSDKGELFTLGGRNGGNKENFRKALNHMRDDLGQQALAYLFHRWKPNWMGSTAFNLFLKFYNLIFSTYFKVCHRRKIDGIKKWKDLARYEGKNWKSYKWDDSMKEWDLNKKYPHLMVVRDTDNSYQSTLQVKPIAKCL